MISKNLYKAVNKNGGGTAGKPTENEALLSFLRYIVTLTLISVSAKPEIKKGPNNLIAKGLLALITLMALLALTPCADAQATSMARTRQYTLLSSVTLSNTQALLTNAALPSPSPGSQAVGVFTNTLIPFSGSHSIGITCQIVNPNNFVANSNLVVTIYPAYDTGGGNANGIGQAYGTNFSATPLLTWTISYKTNTFVSTNLAASQWEPATSLGYTVSNAATGTIGGSPSNITVTLTQSTVP
ncbi:MAG TPA: hypothetical protein VH595_07715 [Verrucomicrobiae bacterium]|jgi:hypothetical protein|nr:hypothetical protein [Verrucomicrobiae bacterium]